MGISSLISSFPSVSARGAITRRELCAESSAKPLQGMMLEETSLLGCVWPTIEIRFTNSEVLSRIATCVKIAMLQEGRPCEPNRPADHNKLSLRTRRGREVFGSCRIAGHRMTVPS